MKQIRNSIFETNSSSTHALTIIKNVEEQPEDLAINHIMLITESNFMDASLITAQDKLNYLFTYCLNKMEYDAKRYCLELKEAMEEKLGYELPIVCRDLSLYFKEWGEHIDGDHDVMEQGENPYLVAEDSYQNNKVLVENIKKSNLNKIILRNVHFDKSMVGTDVTIEQVDDWNLKWAKELIAKYENPNGVNITISEFALPDDITEVVKLIVDRNVTFSFFHT